MVLSCADSRVPPELIFNVGLGDLFVIRTAGAVPSSLFDLTLATALVTIVLAPSLIRLAPLLVAGLSKLPWIGARFIDPRRITYVGILSSVRKLNLEQDVDCFISISGPEPQRTMLEEIALEQAPVAPRVRVRPR